LGGYNFNKYKSEPTKVKEQTINLKSKHDISDILNKAKIISEAQCYSRDKVNCTPDDINATTLPDIVLDDFSNTSITTKIYFEDELLKLNMHGHIAVNRASRHDAVTIKLEYAPENHKKHIILIGKTLTYDSGGLSIKPTSSMVNMKSDKAGGMAVLGIMKAISELNSEYKITAYLGVAENMLDGAAYKPGDVLTMKNGKTVNVQNTDAEGRITLFDQICLAEEENPDFDEMYTLATLTGSAVSQFDGATAAVGFNDKLKMNIIKNGNDAGEIIMNAEFHDNMLDGVKDTMADLTNTGTPNMGCQKAGLFLTYALKDTSKNKFLHLDIAGSAFIDKPFGSNIPGATGSMVRTFINYLAK
jgi:leucyl aminopeptidase